MKSLIYASVFTIIGSCASLSHKEKVQALKDNRIFEFFVIFIIFLTLMLTYLFILNLVIIILAANVE